MQTDFNQQEILLVTTTTFSKRQWCEKENQESRKSLTQTEHLEQACWNGMLNELLPELIEKSSDGKDLYLWHIRQCKSFLEIELCEKPPSIEDCTSIDPYYFLPTFFMN